METEDIILKSIWERFLKLMKKYTICASMSVVSYSASTETDCMFEMIKKKRSV